MSAYEAECPRVVSLSVALKPKFIHESNSCIQSLKQKSGLAVLNECFADLRTSDKVLKLNAVLSSINKTRRSLRAKTRLC